MRIKVTIIIVSLFFHSSAQVTYQKSYRTSFGISPTGIVTYEDKTSIICGDGSYFIKIDSMGNVLWAKELVLVNDSDYNITFNFFKTTDNKIISEYSTFTGGVIIKADTSGNVLWYKRYILNKGGYVSCLNETSDKGFILIGSDLKGEIILRIDSLGNPIWCKNYKIDSLLIRGQAIIETDYGGFLCGGSYSNSLGYDIYFTMKIDSAGNIIHGFTTQKGRPIGASFYRTGINSYFMPGNVFCMCFDSTGSLKWEKYIYFYFGGEAMKRNKNIFCIGENDNYTAAFDIDTLGNVLNSVQYQSPDTFVQFIAGAYNDNSSISIGYLISDYNLYVIKSDSINKSGCFEYPVVIYDSVVNDVTIPITINTTNNSASVSDQSITVSSVIFNDSTYCFNGPLGISKITMKQEDILTLFPNPSDRLFYLHYNGIDEIERAEVFNYLGKNVFSKTGKTEEIDLSNAASGIYFYSIKTKSGGVFNGKMVKE